MHAAERDAFGSHGLRQTHIVHLLTDLYFCIKSGVTDNDKRVGAGSMDPVRIRRLFAAKPYRRFGGKGVLQVGTYILYGILKTYYMTEFYIVNIIIGSYCIQYVGDAPKYIAAAPGCTET